MKPRGQRGAQHPLVVDAATSARLGRVRQKETSAELKVRELLRQLGIRAGRTKRRLPGSPDIVNLSAGWCIFVHGCFWHAHPGCSRATLPKRNRAFWTQKLRANRRRDARATQSIRRLGLRAFVVWECHLMQRKETVLRRLAALRHCELDLPRSRAV